MRAVCIPLCVALWANVGVAEETKAPGTYFGLPGKAGAKTVVFVYDHTGSMDLVKADAAGELMRCVRALDAKVKFNIVCFSGEIKALSPRPIPATDANKASAAKLMDGLRYTGNGGVTEALKQAKNMRPDLVVFITDEPAKDESDLPNAKARGVRVDAALVTSPVAMPDAYKLTERWSRGSGGSVVYLSIDRSGEPYKLVPMK